MYAFQVIDYYNAADVLYFQGGLYALQVTDYNKMLFFLYS